MKNVYLVLTDLHLDFQKANRIDYFGEIIDALSQVMSIANKYREQGYTVTLLLLGDVFDGSVSNPSEAMHATEIFRFFCTQFSKVYSVVGNHEITYAKDNPFWFLVNSVDDIELSGIRRYIQPRGMNNTISVPSQVVDGEVAFYFNHYGIPAKVPNEGSIRIGLFHQNVGSNDICKMWGTFDDVEEAAYVQAYNYSFFGHMHLARGEYFLNESHTCKGIWLGTIGRTKVTEVLDENLDVTVPVIIVEDGVFKEYAREYVHLRPFAACVDVERLKAAESNKELIQEKAATALTSYTGETLFDTLHGSLGSTPLAFFLDFLDRPWDVVLDEYNKTFNNISSSSEDTSTNAENDEGCDT